MNIIGNLYKTKKNIMAFVTSYISKINFNERFTIGTNSYIFVLKEYNFETGDNEVVEYMTLYENKILYIGSAFFDKRFINNFFEIIN